MTWSDVPQAAPPAGWYQDPGGSGGLRYWDGSTWTGHLTESRPPTAATSPLAAPSPAPPAGPPKGTTPIWIWVALGGVLLLFVVGILAAIAVPAFRVGRDAVFDEEAKQVLLDARSRGYGLAGGSGSYTAVTPEALERDDPTNDYTSGESRGPGTVSVYALPERLTLAVRSRSGTCWITDDSNMTSRTGKLRESQTCVAATVDGFEPVEF